MDSDRRKGELQIPDNLKELLNEAQRRALSGMKYTGWELHALRRPLFQEPVLILHNLQDGSVAILDRDGTVKIKRNIKLREQQSPTQKHVLNEPPVWTK